MSNNIELEMSEIESDNESYCEEGMEGTYIKFRYIPTEDWKSDDFYKLVRYIHGQTLATHISFGVEQLDKVAKPTNLHIHIHLYTEKKCSAKDKHKARVATLRKAFQRSEYYKKGAGNNSYSIAAELDVKDPIRFFRYCWKQKSQGVSPDSQLSSWLIPSYNNSGQGTGGKTLKTMWLPPIDDIKLEVEKAHEEWQIAVAYNQKIAARKAEPSSCDKLIAHLEDLNQPEMNVKEIMVEMLKYYTERQQPANKNTLQGYLTIYLLKTGKVSYGAMADKFLAGY